MNTYAVSIHFTQEVDAVVGLAVEAIAKITGGSFVLQNKIPPHVTIGAFHAAGADEQKLLCMVEEFCAQQKFGAVNFTGIGNFKGRVLFLEPQKDDFLCRINCELHERLLKEFEAAQNGLYLPQVWFPHVTLATRLNHEQLLKAQKVAEKILLPLKAEAKEISVYRCSPFVELKRFFAQGRGTTPQAATGLSKAKKAAGA